jgi:hypothetical protein
MSWGELFGEEPEAPKPQQNQNSGGGNQGGGVFSSDAKPLFGGVNRPQRHPDLPPRPAPRPPDTTPSEAWFVGPEPNKDQTFDTKKIVKRTTSILFPLVGLAALIGIIGYVINMVVNIYG